jgi:hypothetical protein
MPFLLVALVAVVAGLAIAGAGSPGPGAAFGAAHAQAAALRWVGAGAAQAARRDEGEWEVDVVRRDGSLVEVTLGPRGRLLGFDEELAAGGGAAPDEVGGQARARAAAAALRATGPAVVLAVERERNGGVEVDVLGAGGRRLEVGVDPRGRVVEVTPEDAGDE